MTKITSVILGFAAVGLLAACGGANYKKTKSGLLYKIISDGKGQTVKHGDFLKMHFSQKINDSVSYTTFTGVPTYLRVDTTVPADYNPLEVIPLLRKGDSAVITQMADTLLKKLGGMQQVPFKKGDKLTITLRILDVMKDEMAVQLDQQKELEAEKAREIKAVEDFLKDKKITAQKTAKGTFVEIANPGSGPAIDSGKYVTVKYTGQTFGGKVFDSNIDPKFNHTEPYGLVIGARGAIEGWDDGLRLFKKGGKGRLFIPSYLGYFDRGGGADIKPFDNLVFDVEIVDVTDAPPAPAQPGPQPASPVDSVKTKK